jgi:hypothetical protein
MAVNRGAVAVWGYAVSGYAVSGFLAKSSDAELMQ